MKNKDHLPMYGIGPIYGGVSIAVFIIRYSANTVCLK